MHITPGRPMSPSFELPGRTQRPSLRLIYPALALAGALLNLGAQAQALPHGADAANITISGISSGAGMAVQYAVAHSASVKGVASIAGPSWACAQGYVTKAVNDCMCGRNTPLPDAEPLAHRLASSGDIDPLQGGKPAALDEAFVFHSAKDVIVVPSTGEASIKFLKAFTGKAPKVDHGNVGDGSNQAAHGILAPQGADSCQATSSDHTYVRHCGEEDNARDLFKALFPSVVFDPSKRTDSIPEGDIQPFDQRPFVNAVVKQGDYIAADDLRFYLFPTRTERRKHLDMADHGYYYVPPSCRAAGAKCGVHLALHGCKQDVLEFARTTGYAHWAELYRVIVVYPAIKQGTNPVSESCSAGALSAIADYAWYQPNPNGCWDWWGYLDGSERTRYLSKRAPQMQVLERIVEAVTQQP
jgi:poly(3-hydroxybutyrate) depolymerase